MNEEGAGRDWRVEKVAREERVVRRQQVNRIKSGVVYLRRGQSVRLQGLKARRQVAGLTQPQLAKRIGTNQTTISELEERHARRGAYVSTIRRLGEALEVAPADLICKYEVPEEGDEGGRRMESATWEKGLGRKEQLDALREQARHIRRDEMTEGGWKVKLQGLKVCRLAVGFTQRDLAKMIGKSQSTIATLENGTSGAALYVIRRLCRALKVLPADLICKDPVR